MEDYFVKILRNNMSLCLPTNAAYLVTTLYTEIILAHSKPTITENESFPIIYVHQNNIIQAGSGVSGDTICLHAIAEISLFCVAAISFISCNQRGTLGLLVNKLRNLIKILCLITKTLDKVFNTNILLIYIYEISWFCCGDYHQESCKFVYTNI